MNIKKSVCELIGNTPMMELCNLEKKYGLSGKLLAKIECFNPSGSVKDRASFEMIDDAERNGRLKPGGTVIEPTSGNTGIGLCAIGASKGYRVIIVMPDSMSVERQKLMRAYGAELVLTEGKLGMKGAIEKAEELQKSIPGSIIAGQFDNPANPIAHKKTTAPEIWRDTDGKIDCFIAGVGTGGTLTGNGEYFKEKKPNVKIVAVEPKDSPLLSEGRSGPHGLQGIGANFVPSILNRDIIDEIFPVTTNEAYESARILAKEEGLLCGISSGAVLYAGIQLAMRPEMKGKNIIILLPDTGERYLSTNLF